MRTRLDLGTRPLDVSDVAPIVSYCLVTVAIDYCFKRAGGSLALLWQAFTREEQHWYRS